MKILVTGGSGTVGKYIVRDLLRHGHSAVVFDLAAPVDSVPFVHGDVRRIGDVEPALRGSDAVIHCAGIPHPLNDPPERVFDVNVNGTFAVLEAAARTGVPKVIFTSSESTLGFAFMERRMAPVTAPIDEQHPLRPQDPYGLSKVIGEEICRSYSSRYGIRTVALRAPWIWVPEPAMLPFYRTLIDDYPSWKKNLWTYVHVFDVAQAHRLAAERDLEQLHEVLFITARENWTGKPSRELLHQYYPETTVTNDRWTGVEAIISHEKARRLLGYEPKFTAKDLLG